MEKKFQLIYLLLGFLVTIVMAQSYMLYDFKEEMKDTRKGYQTAQDVVVTTKHMSAPDPFEEMRLMQEAMQNSFAHFNSAFSKDPFFQTAFRDIGITPRSDVKEDDKNYIIELNIPGAKEQKLDINTQGNLLHVQASVEKNTDTNQTNYMHRERYWQRFERSFRLPENADLDAMKSEYKNGVLKITIPKKS